MKGSGEEITVEVKTVPDITVAYVRHIGPYQGMADVFTDLFQRLMLWAQPRDLIHPPTTRVLAVYHDDPNITADEKLRVDACISVPDGTCADGEVGTMVVPGGRFALGRFELGVEEYGRAWSTIMSGWLPASGYQPDDRLCYELFHNDCTTHPEGKAIVDICVPVKPL
jgi:AraC family transcriptional regulator